MKINRYQESGLNITARRGISLLLAICLLLSLLPAAFATDAQLNAAGASYAGDNPDKISPSAPKVYVKLPQATEIFTGATPGSGRTETVGSGTVLQLVANKYYTAGGVNYYCLYYDNIVWSAQAGKVYQGILSDAQLTDYITGTLWKASSFTSLNKDLYLLGDVRVHGLQMALSRLGHYPGALDGNFGSGTESAVRNFQRANKLDADGRAGPITQALLYPMALNSNNNSNSNSNSSNTSNAGTLKTTASVNLRQKATTKSPRLAIVPRNLTLNYYETTTVSGITWYNVVYANLTGWLMGSFVNASGGGGGSSGGSGSGGGGGNAGVQIGTVTIILPGTRVRQTPNGTKTGVVLAKGSTVPLMGQPSSAAGYNWYPIRTSSGLFGYVRGDCCKAAFDGGGGSSGGGITPSANKTYIKTGGGLSVFTTKEKPTSGLIGVPANQVIQLVSTATYTSGGKDYCSLYYNNVIYNAVYAEVSGWIMTNDELTSYLTEILWRAGYTASLKQELNLVGDVRVHAAQFALSVLGFYTGPLDGNFGSGTESAVRNYQRKNNLTVDGSIGPKTGDKLFPAAIKAYGGSSGGGGGGGVTTEFGNIISIEKASWTTVDGGSTSLFRKNTYATVLDCGTGRVFRVFRWSGGSHADCVPADSSDTKTMCEIVTFPYNSSAPTAAQLNLIKGDTVNNNSTYTWPDFKNKWGGGKDIGSAWDRRPALLNVDGRVFCISIYGWPHGFNGTDSFSKAKFPDGTLFYSRNNYYGMICIHFPGSTTHTSNKEDADHKKAIDNAYNYAKGRWPTLMK